MLDRRSSHYRFKRGLAQQSGNTASGTAASVSGGSNNTASGLVDSVSGGSAPHPPFP
jgi:hypothetical protein